MHVPPEALEGAVGDLTSRGTKAWRRKASYWKAQAALRESEVAHWKKQAALRESEAVNWRKQAALREREAAAFRIRLERDKMQDDGELDL